MTIANELIVRIEANTAQLRRELKRGDDAVRRNTNRMGRSLKKLDRSFAQLGRAAKGFLVAFISVQGIRNLVSTTADFSREISGLAAITGAAGKDLEFFKEQAREMGRTTTKSAAEAAEAFKLIASAKPELLENAKALASITKEAVTLSEASGLTLPDAARALTTALNQFGASADQAGRFINVMAAGAKFGAAEIPDLTSALAKAGTQAASSGISFEEFNAVVQRIAAFKEPIERSATALRNVLIILETGARETRPSIVGLTTALNNLGKQNLDTEQLEARFGRENINLARQLIGVRDSANKLTTTITGTKEAYIQAEIRTSDLDGSLKKLTNAWDELNLSIGEGNGAINDTIDFFTTLLTLTGKVSRGIRDIGTSVSERSTEGLVDDLSRQRDLFRDAGKSPDFPPDILRELTRKRNAMILELGRRGTLIPDDALTARERIIVEPLSSPESRRGFRGSPGPTLDITPPTAEEQRLRDEASARARVGLEISKTGTKPRTFADKESFLAGVEEQAKREAEVERDKAKSIEQTQRRLEISVLRSEGRIEEAIRLSAQSELEAFEESVAGRADAEEQLATFRINLNKRVASEIQNSLEQQTAAARQLGLALETAFQDALFRARDFGDILDALGRKLASIALFGPSGTSGLFGGFFASLGGSLAKVFSGGKAGGGRIQPGIPQLVGERGPEIIIPSVPSTVLNAADSRRAMGGAPPINQTFNITFTTDVGNTIRAEVLNMAPVIAGAAKQGVFDELRRRGF